jgi:hypothetical protein
MRVEAETGKKVKTLHSDNGGEYKSHDFKNLVKKLRLLCRKPLSRMEWWRDRY